MIGRLNKIAVMYWMIFLPLSVLAAKKGDQQYMDEINQAYKANNPVQAHQILEQWAQSGNLTAQFNLSTNYENGVGVQKDLNKAFVWVKKAAEGGAVNAYAKLAGMYFSGIGTKKDNSLALRWREKAGEMGDLGSIQSLGYSYYTGTGYLQKPDFTKAFNWFSYGANMGDNLSKYCAGMMLYFGKGTKKQPEQAQRVWQSMGQRYPTMLFEVLNQGFSKGDYGLKKDMEQASYWQKAGKAIEQQLKLKLKSDKIYPPGYNLQLKREVEVISMFRAP